MRSLNPRGRKVQGSSLLALFPALLPALLLASLIVVSSTAPAMAFTPRTRSEIVRRAMTLMPDALQRQMRRHSRALFEGTLTPSGVEGEAEHALDPGSADRALQQAVARLVSRVDTQQPMREVVRELGRVAHSATDLAFALNIGEDDPREAQIYASFGRYVEKMLPKIAVTFDGFVDADLADDRLSAYARRVAESARRDYDAILRSYYPEGRDATAHDFDERSVAFAAASLGVSRAVSATAKSWLYAWHRAHGDLAGTPLIDPLPRSNPFASAEQAERIERPGSHENTCRTRDEKHLEEERRP